MIRKNQKINGVVISETEHKISQYADDTESLSNGDKNSFEEAMKTIDDFRKNQDSS